MAEVQINMDAVEACSPMIEQDEINRDAEDARGKPVGCMVCTKKTTIWSFKQDSLKPGDHIQMPGAIPCIGRLYQHHAIVSEIRNISDDGRKANVKVVDVTSTGGRRKTLTLEEHNLMDKDEIDCTKTRLTRVDYRKRRHDHDATLNRAMKYKEVMSSGEGDEENNVCCQYFKCCCGCCWSDKYCICLRNCEHFATTIVNGRPEINPQEINSGFCSQAISCGWMLFMIVLFFYILFTLLAYAAKITDTVPKTNDESHNLSSFDNDTKILRNQSHHPANQPRRSVTEHTLILQVFGRTFAVLFFTLTCLLFYLTIKVRIICRQCIYASLCLVNYRLSLYLLSYFILLLHYRKIADWDIGLAVHIFVAFVIAVLVFILIYILSYFCTKLTLWVLANWCCGCCCCKIEKDAHTRGVPEVI